MHNIRKINSDLFYVGASDRRLALFENVYPIPRGVSYNRYELLDEKTVLLDCGGLWSLDDAGETAGAYLLSCGRKRVDLLFLSHLHEDHANGVPMRLELIPVREIILSPNADTDEQLLSQITEALETNVQMKGIKVAVVID